MNARSMRLLRSVAAGLLAGLWICWTASHAHGQTVLGGIGLGENTGSSGTTAGGMASYRGQAAVVAGTALGIPTSVSDTGPLPCSGGAREASLLEQDFYGMLSVAVCHAATIGQVDVAYSEASIGKLGFTTCNTIIVGGNTISADFVMSRALASCCMNGASLGGQSDISGLVINGESIAVSGQPNQTVCLPGGKIVLNEQITTQTADSADITVNALHIVLCEGVDMVVSSSFAGVTCGGSCGEINPSPGECADFVTGGGWITGTPSGAKANFGVAGGFRNDELWGHLNYIDHGNGMHVKATAVKGYEVDPNDPDDCRIIDYDVTIDDAPGTARVRVCDKGEPGRSDIFEIQLSNGYFAGGDLGGSRPGGGNIQLHKCN